MWDMSWVRKALVKSGWRITGVRTVAGSGRGYFVELLDEERPGTSLRTFGLRWVGSSGLPKLSERIYR